MKKSAVRKSRYDVFLSHNTNDKPQVELLAARLVNESGLKPFLDEWHLVPGEPWQEGLEEALSQSASCAVFLGANGLGAWENEEMRVALEERLHNSDFRVIPVLLPKADLKKKKLAPRFLRRLVWVDFRAGLNDQDAYQRLVAGIRGDSPGPGKPVPPPVNIFVRVLQAIFRWWKTYLVGLLLLSSVVVGSVKLVRYLMPTPAVPCGQLSLILGNINLQQWQVPETAKYKILANQGVSIFNAPTPVFLKSCFYQNFDMGFQVKSLNDGGASWALRVKNEANYYLFHLAGPGSSVLKPGFYFYIIQENQFNPTDFYRFFPLPLSDSELGKYLKAEAVFEIRVTVNGQRIQHWITFATNDQEDDPVPRPKVGDLLPLGMVEDLGQHFLQGSIGFRTVGSEQFMVSYIGASPIS